MKKEEKQNFESSMARLEEIVRSLESGDASLADSLKLYEEGVSLLRFCNEELENAEQKVKIVLTKENGETEEKDFTPTKGGADDER